jgi:hypothetical protein
MTGDKTSTTTCRIGAIDVITSGLWDDLSHPTLKAAQNAVTPLPYDLKDRSEAAQFRTSDALTIKP